MVLITADEMAMAGGVFNTANTNYYLYNGQYQQSFSPGYFSSYSSIASVWRVEPSGKLIPWSQVTNYFGVRPVINLKSDITISSGDGTADAPYKIN